MDTYEGQYVCWSPSGAIVQSFSKNSFEPLFGQPLWKATIFFFSCWEVEILTACHCASSETSLGCAPWLTWAFFLRGRKLFGWTGSPNHGILEELEAPKTRKHSTRRTVLQISGKRYYCAKTLIRNKGKNGKKSLGGFLSLSFKLIGPK